MLARYSLPSLDFTLSLFSPGGAHSSFAPSSSARTLTMSWGTTRTTSHSGRACAQAEGSSRGMP
jgi:hypothetical protein